VREGRKKKRNCVREGDEGFCWFKRKNHIVTIKKAGCLSFSNKFVTNYLKIFTS